MVYLEKITSRDNLRLKHARGVREGREHDHIFIEGVRVAAEALRSGLVIDVCFVADDFQNSGLLSSVSERAHAVVQVPKSIFATLADTRQSQGIILIARRPPNSARLISERLTTSILPLVLFLNEINNPSNLGAVIRTAEAAGIAGVAVSASSADVFSPKAIRAAMGSAFRLPVWCGVGFEEAVAWAMDKRMISTAADAQGAKSYTDMDWTVPRLLILGSEAHGLNGIDVKKVVDTIRIPMDTETESLNLAVSAGIILFEARRTVTLDGLNK